MNNYEQQNELECLTKPCFYGTINTTKGGEPRTKGARK